jgi:protein FAM32A
MPSSDYANAVGGGLKLKGAGVEKKKKKRKDKSKLDAEAGDSKALVKKDEEPTVQQALADEELEGDGDEVLKQTESEMKQYGKTEAQRRHDERRRKRVSTLSL